MPKAMKKRIETENQKLYRHIEERMKPIQQGLKSLYLGSDEISGDLIHGLRKSIYHLEDIMRDLLFDEWPAKKILEDMR